MARIVSDLTKYIVPRVNKNKRLNGRNGGKRFLTTDFVSIKSWDEVKGLSDKERRRSLTDFALMDYSSQGETLDLLGKKSGEFWLRSMSGNYDVSSHTIMFDGNPVRYDTVTESIGICPSLTLRVPDGISEIGEIREFKSESGRVLYHALDIGGYPKTRASSDVQEVLEFFYNNGNLRGGLKCTGILFTTNGQGEAEDGFISKQNPEFEYNGERYVRCVVKTTDSKTYDDGYKVNLKSSVQWVKVEPITFKIENYKKFAKGKTKTLELESDQIIVSGVPFYPNNTHENRQLWQNSLIRAFLNSAKSSELDGNPEFRAEYEWDFSKSGFMHQAFDMTREPTLVYTIPETETEICDNAFEGCVGLQKVVIPGHVKRIGNFAFRGCANCQVEIHPNDGKMRLSDYFLEGFHFKNLYVSKDGNSIILSPIKDENFQDNFYDVDLLNYKVENFFDSNYKENFLQLASWKQDRKIKFIPPDYTLEVFPSSQMQKYFVNNNNHRWGKLVRTLGFDTLDETEKNNSLKDLMKIYYAIGGFSENQGESEKAYEYVLNYVATTGGKDANPSQIGAEIHARFSRIEIKGEYNPTFAKFFMKYYHENPDFMNFTLKDLDGSDRESQDYLCMAHNNFDKILKNYPNRVVNGNEERSLLTPKFVAERSSEIDYESVDDGNEKLAGIVGRYGYSQEQFEHMQTVYNRAKKMKDKYVIQADKSKEDGVSFRVLEKDDPLGFVLGDITNCCQHIGGAGEECVDDGYSNPNAGFLVFEETVKDENNNPTEQKRILGQAYVWYDPVTKTVCYDNIEIPTKVLDELRKGNKHNAEISINALMDAVVESADAIMTAMNNKGIKVNRVTTGQGYNDLNDELEERFGKPESNPKAKNRGYNGYTDASDAQYVIRTYDETTKKYAKTIRDTAKTIRADLVDIKTQTAENNSSEM